MNDITQRQPEAPDLPAHRRAAIESGLAQFNQMAHERDEATRERDELHVSLTSTQAERDTLRSVCKELQRTFSQQHESMRDQFTKETEELRERYDRQLNDAQSRVQSMQAERDGAVADRAFLESVLSIIKASIEKAELPPPVRKNGNTRPSIVKSGDQS